MWWLHQLLVGKTLLISITWFEKKFDQPRSFSDGVSREPQGPSASSLVDTVLESLAKTPNVRMIGLQEVNFGIGTLNSGGLFDMAMPIGHISVDNSMNEVVGFLSQNNVGMDWHNMTMHIEEGWIFVKGKKAKFSKPPFDMTLCSHKSISKSKS